MTITAQVHKIIFKLLEDNPDGMQWSDLAKQVNETNPDLHPKTINGLIWKLEQNFPKEVYKPQKGRFRLSKYK